MKYKIFDHRRGKVLSPWNISGRAGYFGILTLVTHTPPTTPKIPELIPQGTCPKIDFGPYHPLKFCDKSCSTVVTGLILS